MKIFILLMFVSLGFAITPDIYGVQDTGSESLPVIDFNLSLDCGNKDLQVVTLLDGADLTMFYTDYGYQPLPNRMKTGIDGSAVMKVPGTLDFLTGLFILRIDKQGYQSREIEFTYEKCFEEPTFEDPVFEGTMDVGQQVGGPEEVTVNETEVIPQEPEVQAEEPAPVAIEEPKEEQTEETPGACPLGILLLSMIFLRSKI